MKFKKKSNRELYERVKELWYNTNLSIDALAKKFGKSRRTIYRWIRRAQRENPISKRKIKKRGRPPKYPKKVYRRIKEIKLENPRRSAPMVRRILKKEFPNKCPSVSMIRKYIRSLGLTYHQKEQKQGFKRFVRERPNELWQIDIAGVQTVGHLGKLYLIALLDDCSRFIVAGQYFTSEKGRNVIKVLRRAIEDYGRPQEILADNGTQFRNILGNLGTKYSRLLEHLGIKPIFARRRHPQTKGKLERFFGTIKQMFLVEARPYVKSHPRCQLADLNQMLQDWLKWYNTEKKHRGLPGQVPPAEIFLHKQNRIYRPLKATINWDRWLYQMAKRKVSKYNEISYKGQIFSVPPGHAGTRVDVLEYEDKLGIYAHENLLIEHPYQVSIDKITSKKTTRKIATNGNIGYQGVYYYIDYKLSGKTVEIQEANLGRELLVYLDGILIKKLKR